MTSRLYHFGLIGYPLEHSLSPRLHRAALDACRLQGDYRLFSIPPGNDCDAALSELVNGLRSGRLHGLNVTIPHKQAVIDHLDRLTPAARAIGAVNTIFWDGHRLVGENTDAPGFLADLRRYILRSAESDSIAYILGAGGAARAIAYALHQAGWGVAIAARRLAQAQEVVDQLSHLAAGPSRAAAQPLRVVPFDAAAIADEIHRLQEDQQAKIVIVNSTPLGMYPHNAGTPWSEEIPLPRSVFVYDLVYNPAQTRLVTYAHRSGLQAASGLGMLVEQAALAFERWTGQQAPRSAMWHAITDGGYTR